MALQVNDNAPSFKLLNEESEPVSLKDFAGKSVVLFFYPKADTPG
jgi:peroxiredoxin Q/BCP